jgi:hypothetical protein
MPISLQCFIKLTQAPNLLRLIPLFKIVISNKPMNYTFLIHIYILFLSPSFYYGPLLILFISTSVHPSLLSVSLSSLSLSFHDPHPHSLSGAGRILRKELHVQFLNQANKKTVIILNTCRVIVCCVSVKLKCKVKLRLKPFLS